MHTRTWIIVGLVGGVTLVLLAIVLVPRLNQPQSISTETKVQPANWPASTPEEHGFDSNKLADGLLALHEQGTQIDSLLVLRNGTLVLDAYFAPYNRTIPHNLASVTKSVMTTLVGIAADQGKLQLDQPVLSFFPERTIANRDARKEAMTVRHLAGMVNGFQSGCLAGDVATINAMRANPDWVQAALNRKVIADLADDPDRVKPQHPKSSRRCTRAEFHVNRVHRHRLDLDQQVVRSWGWHLDGSFDQAGRIGRRKILGVTDGCGLHTAMIAPTSLQSPRQECWLVAPGAGELPTA